MPDADFQSARRPRSISSRFSRAEPVDARLMRFRAMLSATAAESFGDARRRAFRLPRIAADRPRLLAPPLTARRHSLYATTQPPRFLMSIRRAIRHREERHGASARQAELQSSDIGYLARCRSRMPPVLGRRRQEPRLPQSLDARFQDGADCFKKMPMISFKTAA